MGRHDAPARPARRSAAGLSAAFLALAALPGLLAAQAVTPAPLTRAEITFAMRATTVNDFVGRVDSVQARFTGSDAAAATGTVEFRVRDMHTGIGLRDTHLRNAMRADSFPSVRFELVGFIPEGSRGDTTGGVFQGHLTIHGVTQTIRAPGWLLVRGGTTEVSATFPLNMREYGIDPPKRFLGAVRVDPVTTIGVHLTFGP